MMILTVPLDFSFLRQAKINCCNRERLRRKLLFESIFQVKFLRHNLLLV